ncbi:hypothetical protein WICPIJ_006832 [Wickerhamomyces pijperi]|uniref:Ribosome production factor 2 homolog n=1 Tax=Wickerhamomyces pijperi TaxID=599730 RepID=A0A9P8Q1C0_WICPI|nr:hypothetical protein WICPIJ_006832 [Wickerhamomyces pijperi]
MIRTVKPKNARSKRALQAKESKLKENVKTALFVTGATANKACHDITVDLAALKKPDIQRFNKKNEILPFEDASSLEFFSEKNDASLLVFSSNNKKRKNNLTWIRTFGYKIYDMIELQVLDDFKLLQDFKKGSFSVGLKPMFTFNGAVFDSHPVYQHVRSLFLDFFRGEVTDLQDVAGLQHIISITADDVEEGQPLPLVQFRVYTLKTYKSGQKVPRVELNEIGPRLDFAVGRHQSPSPEMFKESMKKARQLEAKSKKNVETDLVGDKIGRVHVGKQDLNQLQTRKMKGLKKRFDQVGEDFDDLEYEGEEEHVAKKAKK